MKCYIWYIQLSKIWKAWNAFDPTSSRQRDPRTLFKCSPISKCQQCFKKKKSHQTFVQLFYSRLWWITPVTRTENFPQLKKNSTPFSMWSPMSKPSLRLPGIFRNLDFISHLGWRITIQPKPQSWHLPLDYALVLSTIRVEWVNNEKQLTLLFIRSSIVLLVIWLASMFISVRHSSEQQAQILFALVWLCQ